MMKSDVRIQIESWWPEQLLQRALDTGIALEKAFFLDYELENGSVLRVFRLRKDIDRADVALAALDQDEPSDLYEL